MIVGKTIVSNSDIVTTCLVHHLVTLYKGTCNVINVTFHVAFNNFWISFF